MCRSNSDPDPLDLRWLASSADSQSRARPLPIPLGYDAYLKLMHPAQTDDCGDVSWSEIANSARLPITTSTTLIELCLDSGRREDLALPPDGIMPDATCHHLVRILAQFTSTPHQCATVFSSSWGELLPADRDLERRLYGARKWSCP